MGRKSVTKAWKEGLRDVGTLLYASSSKIQRYCSGLIGLQH